ncbi:hypothetical protein ACWC10_29990 [Streptomyces sp. NPDC001595]|uniref:hypothetical protein n=1 Tax=Streptomyces sp. NPDC001532 TaxID=3154520 RepID=UPI00331818A6
MPTPPLPIARELDITGEVVTGAELARMDEPEIADHVEDIAVFTRVAPEQRARAPGMRCGHGSVQHPTRTTRITSVDRTDDSFATSRVSPPDGTSEKALSRHGGSRPEKNPGRRTARVPLSEECRSAGGNIQAVSVSSHADNPPSARS